VGVRVPNYAADNARHALEKRKGFSNPPGMSRGSAGEKGITSGLDTARTLIRVNENDQELSEDKARQVLGFLRRNHGNKHSDRNLVARMLWGDTFDQRFQKYLERRLD